MWDDDSSRWTLTTSKGETISTQFYIMASGCLSHSKLPEIPGVESFAGPTYHTGHWPHEGVDLTGLRVGVIGTGSSAIQSIPMFAEQAAELTVFQRTPNFSMPAGNRPLDPEEVAAMKARYREHREAARQSGFGVPVEEPTKSALEATPEEREVAYQKGWDSGNLVGMLLAFNDLLYNKEANDTAAEFIRNKIRSIVKDPQTAEDLCPFDHPMGTKRPCLDTGYYETFNRDNVTLVNLRREPIDQITPTGIRTSDREFEFDAIVFATGFDAMTGALVAVDIQGRDGLTLKEKWADGTRTYLGLMVAGFPNFFTITGPASPSVFSNMMVSIEQHVDWIGGRHGAPPGRREGRHRGHPGSRGLLGRAQPRSRRRHALPARQLVVHGLERARQAAGADAVHRRCWRLPPGVRRDRGRRLPRLRDARRSPDRGRLRSRPPDVNDEVVGDAATELLDMRANRRVVPDLPPPLRPTTLTDAYAIQHRVVADLVAQAGGQCIGYKVACTNDIAQAALQIDRPLFGRLMSQSTSPSGTTLVADRFIHRVIEAEFAFRVGVDVDPVGVATRTPRSPSTSTP